MSEISASWNQKPFFNMKFWEQTYIAVGKGNHYGKENPFEEAMITSKLTSKAQTTIPQPVRTALHLKEGDEIAYTIEKGRVILTKLRTDVRDDPFATFNEWDSDADRKAYGQL